MIKFLIATLKRMLVYKSKIKITKSPRRDLELEIRTMVMLLSYE
jgi:hypothetical protein